ncbi:MAG TPA: PhoH family protein [Pantanalinema sp.]
MPTEIRIPLKTPHDALLLTGNNEENLRLVEHELGIQATMRGNELVLMAGDDAGESLELGRRLFEELEAWQGIDSIKASEISYALRQIRSNPDAPIGTLYAETIVTTQRGKPIRAKTLHQRAYVKAINDHTLTFGLGPAGTGKSFLAVAMAVSALRDKRVSRIILTRPAVEAGENLGFLPGDFQAKVDPYFRPLYDALYEMMDVERFQKYVERGTIEVAPLAFMRGRTLNDAFIILDEAQNTTPEQMKMFLTRLGFGSKVVVTGDASQTDLPRGKTSGLADIESLLQGVHDIAFVKFTQADVVRHDLVGRIVKAYERYEAQKPHDSSRNRQGSR